jgi:hypothetical protein
MRDLLLKLRRAAPDGRAADVAVGVISALA